MCVPAPEPNIKYWTNRKLNGEGEHVSLFIWSVGDAEKSFEASPNRRRHFRVDVRGNNNIDYIHFLFRGHSKMS